MLLTAQCRKDKLSTDPGHKLAFSKDTILFDTVFTTVGSTTQQLKLYNNNNRTVNISSVTLAGGSASPFRINLDGVPGTSFEDIEIESDDSLFLFAEVTLDANNLTNPLIIEDSIIFYTNGNRQSVRLVVWGQDAYFHTNELVEGTWANDKPHVIYGTAAVGALGLDSGKVLNIPAGTQVHLHANSRLYVYKSTLNVMGSEGDEVVFQGDRLEPYYQDKPGQWDGIWLIHSENSQINHAIVKNGERGIWAYKTNPGSSNPALTLNNTESRDNAFSGIWCDESFVIASNNLFANNGSHDGAFIHGGVYNFEYCTFANYWSWGTRNTPGMLLNNYYQHPSTLAITPYNLQNTTFKSCIFYGNNSHEFAVDTVSSGAADFNFEQCFIRSDETSTPSGSFYNGIFKNINPAFADPNNADFTLGAGSPAIDAGTFPNPGIDIDNNSRDANGDIGCYEYL